MISLVYLKNKVVLEMFVFLSCKSSAIIQGPPTWPRDPILPAQTVRWIEEGENETTANAAFKNRMKSRANRFFFLNPLVALEMHKRKRNQSNDDATVPAGA